MISVTVGSTIEERSGIYSHTSYLCLMCLIVVDVVGFEFDFAYLREELNLLGH